MKSLLPLFPRFTAPRLRPMDGGDDDKTITLDQVKRLIAREGKGDSHEAIKTLLRENRKTRKRAQDAEKRVKDLEDAKRIAPEGGVVLSPEEAKQWKVIQPYLAEQKLDGEKLVAAAKKTSELATELAQRDDKDRIAKAASEIGYNAAALKDVLELKKLDVEMRDVQIEDEDSGKKVTVKLPHVRATGDDKAQWSLLTEYAEENLKTFLPALTAKADDAEEETEARTNRRTQPQGGVRVPDQSRSRRPAAPGKSDEKIREEAADTGAFSVL